MTTFVKNMTYEELSASYDAQIKALLREDYEEFQQLIQYLDTDESWSSHEDAWACTGDNALSLFSALPECAVCASQVEYLEFLQKKHEENSLNFPMGGFTGEEEAYADLVLAAKKCSLPNLNADERGKNHGNYNFSKKELLEFKRRQLVAHFPPTVE